MISWKEFKTWDSGSKWIAGFFAGMFVIGLMLGYFLSLMKESVVFFALYVVFFFWFLPSEYGKGSSGIFTWLYVPILILSTFIAGVILADVIVFCLSLFS